MSFFTKDGMCDKCGKSVLPHHRWKMVNHKFLFFRWFTVEHRDCDNPMMGTTNPYRESWLAEALERDRVS